MADIPKEVLESLPPHLRKKVEEGKMDVMGVTVGNTEKQDDEESPEIIDMGIVELSDLPKLLGQLMEKIGTPKPEPYGPFEKDYERMRPISRTELALFRMSHGAERYGETVLDAATSKEYDKLPRSERDYIRRQLLWSFENAEQMAVFMDRLKQPYARKAFVELFEPDHDFSSHSQIGANIDSPLGLLREIRDMLRGYETQHLKDAEEAEDPARKTVKASRAAVNGRMAARVDIVLEELDKAARRDTKNDRFTKLIREAKKAALDQLR